ncbi:MAG: glycyl-radical enzyme activating protein [Bacteroidales bacterium]
MEIDKSDSGYVFRIKRFSIHDGPGIRTTVFLKGCAMSCSWCHSPEGIEPGISVWHEPSSCICCLSCVEACNNEALDSIHATPTVISVDRSRCTLAGDCVNACPTGSIQFTGHWMTTEAVMKEIFRDVLFYNNSGGGITLSGGEPFFQPGFAASILRACKNNNINTAVETSLYCDRQVIESIQGNVDLFYVDLKIIDPIKHEKYTGRKNDIIIDNLRYLAGEKNRIIVRIPVIENITGTHENLTAIRQFVSSIDPSIAIEELSYNILAENNYRKLRIPFFRDKG